jgi:hypothetical protein
MIGTVRLANGLALDPRTWAICCCCCCCCRRFLVVFLREAFVRRRFSARCGCLRSDEDHVTASAHRECSFSRALSSKALSPKGSSKGSLQLPELALTQQQQQQQQGADLIRSVGSSGANSAGPSSGPPSPTVAILMK